MAGGALLGGHLREFPGHHGLPLTGALLAAAALTLLLAERRG
ncbi:hypothetical protein ACF09J_24265 [Streptomyces sp. NPDC014889]